MNNNFVLTEKLQLFLSIGSHHRLLKLGDKFPVSIRKRNTFSQSIFIYPESDFPCFTSREVQRFLSLANDLDLVSFVSVNNGVPVVEIEDYDIND